MKDENVVSLLALFIAFSLFIGFSIGVLHYKGIMRKKGLEVKLTMDEVIAMKTLVYTSNLNFDADGVSLYEVDIGDHEFLVAVKVEYYISGKQLIFNYARVGDRYK